LKRWRIKDRTTGVSLGVSGETEAQALIKFAQVGGVPSVIDAENYEITPWTPWESFASPPLQLEASGICVCARCVADGPHAPRCDVHKEPPATCDCGRRPTRSS